MSYVKSILLAVVAIVLIVVALANASMVTLRLLPDSMAGFLGLSWMVSLPMFVVILGALIVGLLIGFVAEWARERKYRSAVRSERREKDALRRENEELRTRRVDNRGNGAQDILALLDDGSTSRS